MYDKTTSPKYLRDKATKALVNIDDAEYRNILALRKKSKEIQSLRNELQELKELVLGRMNKNDD